MVSTKLRVKSLLRERRWTTKVLAEKTGLSESYLTHIKNGTRRWNEDSLKKLAEAFELQPADILASSGKRTDDLANKIQLLDQSLLDQGIDSSNQKVNVRIIPVVGKIPENPSPYNNQLVQVSTGYKDQFVPVQVEANQDSDAMFCLSIRDNTLSPHFVHGDYLIISPGIWTKSGDIVAVEYEVSSGKKTIDLLQVNYMDDLVVFESINHKKAPIALTRGKDNFRIIGKVTNRYQKMP